MTMFSRAKAGAVVIALALIALLGIACTQDSVAPQHPELTIDLRWIKSYPRETKSRVETGLLWTLSYLGARWPNDADGAMKWRRNVVTVDLATAGIAANTKPAWKKLLAVLKGSDEYKATGAIDIGRFVALTLCSSHHYYALTGANENYEDFRSRYRFEPKNSAIIESIIAKGHRLVDVGAGRNFGGIAFVAYEGTGSIPGGSFQKQEIEVLDFMENGQLRFALYGLDGKLKPSAASALTAAGKPGKCLWCHELTLMKTFNHVTDVPGYFSSREFDNIIDSRMAEIRRYRNQLDSLLDFDKTQDHTFAELLYLAFLEPSLQRLANEWNVPAPQAERMLRGKSTHPHHELPLLGSRLYRREEVDGLGPYATIAVPADAREPSPYEPDLLR